MNHRIIEGVTFQVVKRETLEGRRVQGEVLGRDRVIEQLLTGALLTSAPNTPVRKKGFRSVSS